MSWILKLRKQKACLLTHGVGGTKFSNFSPPAAISYRALPMVLEGSPCSRKGKSRVRHRRMEFCPRHLDYNSFIAMSLSMPSFVLECGQDVKRGLLVYQSTLPS